MTRILLALVSMVSLATTVVAQDHVAPAPPSQPMPQVPHDEMMRLMAMDDTGRFGKVTFDQLEARLIDGDDAFAWNAHAWYGGDFDKLWVKFHGEDERDADLDWSAEVLWDHAFHRWWSVQTGVRHDEGAGPSRSWLALGTQGLAPYWFEIEATFYVGDGGRTAFRFETDYELLLTQRLVLQPEVELNAYGESDDARGIGSGLSDAQVGVRLRYEIRREIAPYIGIQWTRSFGRTERIARAEGHDDAEWATVAGLRLWF